MRKALSLLLAICMALTLALSTVSCDSFITLEDDEETRKESSSKENTTNTTIEATESTSTKETSIDEVSTSEETTTEDTTLPDDTEDYPFKQTIEDFYPSYADNAATIKEGDASSKNIALVDLSSNTIIASRRSGKSNVVYPASLTKVMTIIVVAENIKYENDLNQKITISRDVVDKMIAANSSGYGFKAGDVLTVNELIHAVMLYSDGTACITLAEYISGSEAKFVELMNAKAKEMGLLNTNFTNCTGLHNQYHFSTAQDLAAMMAYAMKNTFCANVITAEAFSIGSHFRPESGNTYTMYNQVTKSLKATQPTTCKFYGGKTGLTDEAKYCLVSYSKTKDGKEYILVTLGAESATLRNQDHIDILNKYVKAN